MNSDARKELFGLTTEEKASTTEEKSKEAKTEWDWMQFQFSPDDHFIELICDYCSSNDDVRYCTHCRESLICLICTKCCAQCNGRFCSGCVAPDYQNLSSFQFIDSCRYHLKKSIQLNNLLLSTRNSFAKRITDNNNNSNPSKNEILNKYNKMYRSNSESSSTSSYSSKRMRYEPLQFHQFPERPHPHNILFYKPIQLFPFTFNNNQNNLQPK